MDGILIPTNLKCDWLLTGGILWWCACLLNLAAKLYKFNTLRCLFHFSLSHCISKIPSLLSTSLNLLPSKIYYQSLSTFCKYKLILALNNFSYVVLHSETSMKNWTDVYLICWRFWIWHHQVSCVISPFCIPFSHRWYCLEILNVKSNAKSKNANNCRNETPGYVIGFHKWMTAPDYKLEVGSWIEKVPKTWGKLLKLDEHIKIFLGLKHPSEKRNGTLTNILTYPHLKAVNNDVSWDSNKQHFYD